MSGKTNKLFSKVFGTLLFVIALLAVPSCEIGLGEAVDTQVPEPVITLPTSETPPIRKSFPIMGTVKDDGVIASISVSIKGIDTSKNDDITRHYSYIRGKEAASTISFDDSGETWTWECMIDPFQDKPNAPKLIDGSYEATVVFEDLLGHKSTVNRTFKVDNTPPIVVLQRPSSVFDDSPSDVDTYGQEFTLEGQSADDSDVGTIEVKIYEDPELTKYKDTITLKQVPPTVDMTVMKWAEDGTSKYNDLYGKKKSDGTKIFYCALVAYDDARPCPDTGDEAGKGNSAEYYYLYNNIYSSILKNYKLTQVYSILNGTYTNSAGRAAEDDDDVKAVKEALANSKTLKGSFALNPLNNPTFSVSGQDPISKNAETGAYKFPDVINDSVITVKVSSGLDNVPLMNDTIGINLIHVDPSDLFEDKTEADGSRSKVIKPKNGDAPIKVFAPYKDKDGVVQKDKKGNDYTAESIEARNKLITKVGSYDRTIALTVTKSDGLQVGEYYVLDLTAFDENKNNALNTNVYYGFKLTSNGAAPEMSVTKPDPTIQQFMNATGTIDVVATAKHGDGNPSIEVFLSGVEDPIYGPITGTSEDKITSISKTFSASDFTSTGKFNEGTNTITIRSKYGEYKTEVERTITYDITPPEVVFTKVTPVVSKYKSGSREEDYCLNGEVTFAGTMFDSSSIASATYTVKGKKRTTNVISEIVSGELDPKKTTFEIKVDTKDTDEVELLFEITAKDRAGNTFTKELKADNGNNYYIWQESDKPQIEVISLGEPFSADDAKTDISKMKGALKGASLSYTLSDDDGLKKVTAYTYSADETNQTEPYKKGATPNNSQNPDSKKDDYNGAVSATTTVTAPSDSGYYWLEITATDINNVVNKYESLFKVESGAPSVMITSSETEYVSKTGNGRKTIPVTVKVSGLGVFKLYQTPVADENDSSKWEKTDNILFQNNFATEGTLSNQLVVLRNAELSPLTEVENTVVLIAKDSRDTQKGRAELKVIFDNDAPEAPTFSFDPNDTKVYSSNGITFKGTATDTSNSGKESGISKVYYKLFANGTAYNTGKPASPDDFTDSTKGWTAASGSTSWNFRLENLRDGKDQVVAVYALDGAENYTGNTSNFTVDTVKPVIEDVKLSTTDGKTITAKITDATSGVKTVELLDNGRVVKTFDSTAIINNQLLYKLIKDDTRDDLPVGDHMFSLRATDAAGNQSTEGSISIKIEKPVVTLSATYNSKALASGGYVAGSKQIAFTGTVTDNSTATDGTNTVTNTYTYTWDGATSSTNTATVTTANTSGDKTVKLKVANIFGQETEVEFKYNVDTENPEVTITSPSDGKIEQKTFRLEGTASDEGSGVDKVYYAIKTTTPAESDYKEAANTSWNFTQQFVEGTATAGTGEIKEGDYKLYVKATDKAGNVSDVGSKDIKVDLSAPSVKDIKYKNSDGEVTPKTVSNQKTLTKAYDLYFTISDTNALDSTSPVTVTYSKDGGAATTITPAVQPGATDRVKTYKATIDSQADGIYEYTITAKDKAGKTTTVTETVRLDTTAPTFEATSPSFDNSNTSAWQQNNKISVKGNASDDSGISGVYYATTDKAYPSGDLSLEATWTGDGWTKAGNSNWTISPVSPATTWSDGSQNFYVVAVDKCGLRTDKVHYILKVDAGVPTATVASKWTDGSTFTATVSDSVSGIDSVLLYDDTKLVDSSLYTKTNSGSTYTFAIAAGAKTVGTHKFNVKASDNAGNEKTSGNLEMTIAEPVVTLTAKVGSDAFTSSYIKGGKTITFTVGVTDNSSAVGVTKTYTYVWTGLTTASTSETGTYAAPTTGDSEQTVKVTVKNSFGIESSKEYKFILDNTKPTVTMNLPTADDTKAAAFTFTGTTTEAGSGVKSLKMTIKDDANASMTQDFTLSTSENWSQKVKFADYAASGKVFSTEGKKKITLTAEDNAGNSGAYTSQGTSPVVNYEFVYDKADPTFELTNTFPVYLGTAGFTANATVKDTYKLDLNSLITVNETFTPQAGGSAVTKSAEYKYDGSTFTVKRNGTGNFVAITSGEIALDGTATANKEYKLKIKLPINGGTVTDGTYKYTFTVKDSVGNEVTSKEYSTTADSVVPAIATGKVKVSDTAYSALSSSWFNSNSTSIKGETGAVTDAHLDLSVEVKTNNASDGNFLMNSDGSFTSNRSISDGKNTVVFTFKDEAGNTNALSMQINVDAKVPTVSNMSLTATGTDSVTKEGTVKVTLTADDTNTGVDVSGLEKAWIGTKSGFTESEKLKEITLSETSGGVTTYPVTKTVTNESVDISNDTKVPEGSNELWIRVFDKAGNAMNDQKIGTFIKDKTAPTVTINDVADADDETAGTQVNKKFTLSGTVTDSNIASDAVPKLYVGSTELTSTNISGLTKTRSGQNWTISGIDTTQTAIGEGDKTFKVVFTDKAGNEGNKTVDVKVDQDSDRPKIKIKEFAVKDGSNYSTKKANATWYLNNKIAGDVSDDDGITSLQIASSTDGTNWGAYSANLYTAGTWEYSGLSDGTVALKFKVVDSANTTFESAVYSSAAALQNTPKIRDKDNNKIGTKGTTGDQAATIIWAKVDTVYPNVTEVKAGMSDSDLADASTFFSGKTVGGPSSKVYLKFKATDDNGVNTSKVRVELWGTKDGETSKVNTYNASAVSGETDYYKVEIDTSKTAKASDNTTLVSAYTNLQYRVIVEDNAGKSSNENYSVIYDNEGPVLSFSYITSTKYYGCVDNTIVGQSRDVANTTITDVYMKIVKDTDTVANTDAESTDGDPAKGWVKITDTTKTNKTNVYGWSVKFTTQTSEQNVYVTSQLNEYLDKIYTPTATEASDKQSNKDEIKKLKFAFYAVDALGNKGAVLEESVDIDPNGDRPNTEIVFPAKDEDATGGSVRLTGTSVTPSYEIGTSTVWIQVDMNYNGTAFNESWETDIQQIITDKGGYSVLGYEIENAYYVKTGMDEATGKVTTGITFYKDSDKSATVTARGIKADLSSTNWVKYINKLDEFKPDTGTRKMAVRVYAISPTGKVSLPETRVFLIDASAPQFENLELVKYQDNTAGTGTVTARQTYEDDMWISGEWWLEGKATDDNKLESVIWTDKDGTSTNITKGASDTDKSWTIHKKVGISTADSFGSVSYILNATEDSDQKKSTRKDIRLNYDNKKPTFSLTNTLDADDNVTNKIRNSNGYFTPTGTAEEKGAQSGIDKIVTFYKRTVSSTNYGIDPIAAKSGTSFNNAYSVTFDSDTGIPFVTNVAATKDTGTLDIKVTTASNIPAFARKGGLVRIDNILYVIDSISGQVISLDKQPPASMSKVDFAVAQVVEEGRVESADADSDSDGLIEKLQNIAGTYDWMAAINSNNIEDGSITAGYVCFDNAGNYTKIEKSTKVINNAPRIAGFRYGTDENGDGSVTGTELKTDLTGLNDAHNGMKDDKPIDDDSMSAGRNVYRGSDYPTKGSSTEPLFTIKGITEIYPEVVGGNGNLKYGYTVKNSSGTATRTVTGQSFATNSDTVKYDTIVGDKAITIGLSDFIKSGNNIPDGVDLFTFTISDSTKTGGAQSASFAFHANVVVQDTTAPVGKIKPFFWKKAGKPDAEVTKIDDYYNSVYDGSLSNGHIELEDDWKTGTGYDSTKTTGLEDDDPKVSGKIVIRGTASDNSLLKELWFKIDGFTFTGVTADSTEANTTNGYSKLASYVPGTGWTYEKSETDFNAETGASNFYIKTLNETIGQDGHSVDWELGIDTEKITNVAETDVKVQLLVTDRGKLTGVTSGTGAYTPNTSSSSTTQTTTTTETPYYRMDVVPYITKVTTGLSSETIKAVDDFSSINRSALGVYPVLESESISLEGFNLGTNIAKVTDGVLSTPLSLAKVGEIDNSFSVSTLKSGNWSVSVNGVTASNNNNKNDACGSYSVPATGNKGYENFYNRKMNNDNNNNLNDDLKFEVWQVNNRAARNYENAGGLTEPVVKVNPTSGLIGMAFRNGAKRFNMPDSTYSYREWQQNYAKYVNIAMTYSADGNAHGISTGIDTEPSSGKAGKMSYFRSSWGVSAKTGRDEQTRNFDGTNAVRFESIGLAQNATVHGSQVNGWLIMEERFATPSIAVSGNDRVYFAYYDDVYNQLCFKTGNITSERANNGQFVHHGNDDPGFVDSYKTIIAGQTGAASYVTNNGMTLYAGEYICIDVQNMTINNVTTDVVVATWYDATRQAWMYSYNTNPRYGAPNDGNNRNNNLVQWTENNVQNYWSKPVILSNSAGEYCKIKFDSEGGVHIAAKKSSQVLYTYLSSYSATPSTPVIVDSGEDFTDIGLDVEVVGDTNTGKKAVPHITYQSNSRPKLAYAVGGYDSSNGAQAGMSSVEGRTSYNGNWEICYVPTTSSVRKDHMNVNTMTGITKPNATNAAKFKSEGGRDNGTCYVNGTNNPLLGYAIKEGSRTYIEIAQKKDN